MRSDMDFLICMLSDLDLDQDVHVDIHICLHLTDDERNSELKSFAAALSDERSSIVMLLLEYRGS